MAEKSRVNELIDSDADGAAVVGAAVAGGAVVEAAVLEAPPLGAAVVELLALPELLPQPAAANDPTRATDTAARLWFSFNCFPLLCDPVPTDLNGW